MMYNIALVSSSVRTGRNSMTIANAIARQFICNEMKLLIGVISGNRCT